MAEKARIDPALIAHLRETSRPLRPEASLIADTTPPAAGHTLFLSAANGYSILERDGPAPRPGEKVVVDGATYRATGLRRSPFPADRRPCVILEAAG